MGLNSWPKLSRSLTVTVIVKDEWTNLVAEHAKFVLRQEGLY